MLLTLMRVKQRRHERSIELELHGSVKPRESDSTDNNIFRSSTKKLTHNTFTCTPLHTLLKMKAYSIDFRQKILDTYHAEPISQKAIAQRFSVTLSFVQKLLKQYRETKNITPRTDRCGVKGKLNAEQLLILGELIEANNDATLEELRYLLYEKIGFSLSISTIARMIKLLDITVKKKLSSLQAKAPTEFNSCDVSSGKKLKRLVLKT